MRRRSRDGDQPIKLFPFDPFSFAWSHSHRLHEVSFPTLSLLPLTKEQTKEAVAKGGLQAQGQKEVAEGKGKGGTYWGGCLFAVLGGE